MKILLMLLFSIAWVAVPGALIGWIAGFFDWQIVAAILWGLFILYTYPRSRRRWGGKVDALTYFLALVQAGIGGVVVFFVGQVTH
jgi:hypothetical protein